MKNAKELNTIATKVIEDEWTRILHKASTYVDEHIAPYLEEIANQGKFEATIELKELSYNERYSALEYLKTHGYKCKDKAGALATYVINWK